MGTLELRSPFRDILNLRKEAQPLYSLTSQSLEVSCPSGKAMILGEAAPFNLAEGLDSEKSADKAPSSCRNQ